MAAGTERDQPLGIVQAGPAVVHVYEIAGAADAAAPGIACEDGRAVAAKAAP
ncbi:MAG: hypothetical protein ACRD4Q_00205 [Candidatus Acidiferrales bacterium]